MRIEAYTQVQQLYQTNRSAKAGKAAKGSFSDRLQISTMGKDIQVAKQAVAGAPDIRANKIASIKSAIQNGTYQVDENRFAEKLLQKYNEVG